tara:strand:+ start:705 stop:1235 length:531 start_codon:yes stop_codon:yes gene_type:complete
VNKSEIRKKILKIRKNLIYKNFDINFKYLLNILRKEKIKSKIIGGYFPYNYEVDVINILNKFENKGYVISLPKIKKKSRMDFFHWSTKDPLSINKYGIPEPTSDKILHPGILLVPLVAYDKECNRIGYGGGFYDRYINRIKKNKKVITIGLAYSFQKIRKVPTNEYDMKLDFIVTN